VSELHLLGEKTKWSLLADRCESRRPTDAPALMGRHSSWKRNRWWICLALSSVI